VFFRGNKVPGIDVEGKMIKSAHERLNRWGINSPRIAFKEIDIRHLPEDKKYDQILCFEVLEHIVNDEDVIQKLCSLLNLQGIY